MEGSCGLAGHRKERVKQTWRHKGALRMLVEHLWVPCAGRYSHQETAVCPGPPYARHEVKVLLEQRQDINTQEGNHVRNMTSTARVTGGPQVRVTRGSKSLSGEVVSKPSLSG